MKEDDPVKDPGINGAENGELEGPAMDWVNRCIVVKGGLNNGWA